MPVRNMSRSRHLSQNQVVFNMRAFTLIEVVISVALFAIVMFGMTQLYIVYGRIITAQKSSIEVALDGSGIIDATQAAALQADHVVATHIFSGVSYNSGTTTAIFELPTFDSAGTRIQNVYDYIGIVASSTNVYRVIDAAPGSARSSGQKLVARVLSALSFTYDDPNFLLIKSVIIEATTSAMVRGQTAQVHLRGHFYLRNI